MLEAELDAARRSSVTSTGEVRIPGPGERSGPLPGTETEAPLDAGAVEWVDLVEDHAPSTRAPTAPATGLPGHDAVPVVPEPRIPEPRIPVPGIPEPGRHARRRGPRRRLAGVLETVGGQVRFTPAHVTVVATVLVAALGITCWWLLAGRVEPVLSPVASPVRTVDPGVQGASPSAGGSPTGRTSPSRPPGGAGTAATAAATGGAEIVVDVAGKVRRPGIVVLPAGSRVVDALEAAGGARRGVDLSPLNLARPLNDGEQILVGVDAPAQGAGGGPAAGGPAGGAGSQLVNINTASLDELDTLPGVGPVTAQAIVDWRTRHGGFTAVDDLLEVDGIGDATLQKLAPLVTL